jgi:hypothetical protein
MSTETGNGKVKVTAAMLAAPPQVEIEVKFLSGEGSFKAFFADTDPETERQYRRIANKDARNGQLKQKSLDDGMEFVFNKKFQSTNIDWDGMLEGLNCETEKDYFLKDPNGNAISAR